jgi:hypothetical protein
MIVMQYEFKSVQIVLVKPVKNTCEEYFFTVTLINFFSSKSLSAQRKRKIPRI